MKETAHNDQGGTTMVKEGLSRRGFLKGAGIGALTAAGAAGAATALSNGAASDGAASDGAAS